MKYLFFIVTILTCSIVYSQIDANGNPIFNSIIINQQNLDGFKLTSSYYTIQNNIENKNSSVFISKKPTLNEVEYYATELPSDFFLITIEQQISNMILIVHNPTKKFIVMNMVDNTPSEYKMNLKGDITQNRAEEIIKLNYDSNAEIKKGTLYFNDKKFKIIPSSAINKAILSLIKKENLNKPSLSGVKLLSQNEIQEMILIETKSGGQLDYFTEIKDREFDAVQIKPGVFSTKLGVALYKWGRATFDNGLNSLEDAYKLFEIFRERELNKREKDYIKMGFNKELEK